MTTILTETELQDYIDHELDIVQRNSATLARRRVAVAASTGTSKLFYVSGDLTSQLADNDYFSIIRGDDGLPVPNEGRWRIDGAPTLRELDGETITAVTQSNTNGLGEITVAGNFEFTAWPGVTLTIDGSTGNDDDYIVTARNHDSGNTVITLDRPLPNGTADGEADLDVTRILVTQNNEEADYTSGQILYWVDQTASTYTSMHDPIARAYRAAMLKRELRN